MVPKIYRDLSTLDAVIKEEFIYSSRVLEKVWVSLTCLRFWLSLSNAFILY